MADLVILTDHGLLLSRLNAILLLPNPLLAYLFFAGNRRRRSSMKFNSGSTKIIRQESILFYLPTRWEKLSVF
jgi:hypothetical protein